MADPTAIVPYHDPFDDDQCTDDILMFDENPSLNLSELPTLAQPNYLPPPAEPPDEIADANDPFMDPFLWSVLNDTIGSSQAGPSEIHGETSNHHHHQQQQQHPQTQNLDFGNPIQLSIWPVPPLPYTCSCCQVLREITHTDGIHVTKLEIHGRLGIICHAVLETRSGVNWNTQKPQHQMFDFCKKSIESVKQFLVQYCEGRKQEGYAMVQDPLSIFYEALCVGLINGDSNLDTDDFFQASPTDSGEGQMNQPETVNQPQAMNQPQANELRLPRTLAAQRERTASLKLHHVKKYFHLPIDNAAKKMNICPTVMKKICRRGGLSRWPYRRIKSIEKKIAARMESLNAYDMEERKRAKAEIESLEQELADIFAGIERE